MDKITPRLLPRDVVEPKSIERDPSPAKAGAGPPAPGSSQSRSDVDTAIDEELSDTRYMSEDLPDRMFGHLVSTELARDVLNHFITSGYVKVAKEQGTTLLLESDDVERALDQAFQDAKENGLRRLDSQEPTPTQGKTDSERTAYSWEWQQFPSEPIQEDQLVEYLNLVIERAFHFAQTASRLVAPNDCLHHRFAAPPDKLHPLPLSYRADGEDMRPDFLLLPVDAFQADSQMVDEQYVNFTAVRAVGHSKTRDMSYGVNQVQRYLRAMRRSQPWLHFVIAMVMTASKLCLMRGDSSGTVCVRFSISEGRGCIEFIRILLGLALADPVDLGQNPDVELDSEVQTLVSASAFPGMHAANCVQSLAISRSPSPIHATSTSLSTSSSCAKRKRPEVDSDDDDCDVDPRVRPSKKRKIVHVDRRVFFPTRLYGHVCQGLLYTASSLRGRCTVVFCVAEPASLDRLAALKMSWQDAARLSDQEEVLDTLSQHEGHPNAILPRKHFRALRNGKYCSTLEGIGGFLDDQLAGLGVENRFLAVSLSDLKRPVKYFWGLHDFVRGLRGALLGHEYLVSIGILHRDFSENNMVLALFPGNERGYLIDPDMAILQAAAKPTQPVPPPMLGDNGLCSFSGTNEDETTPAQGLRTGTTPYMSLNVLRGGHHTHFDDVESFLYVLLLFFFSYAGPLDKKDLLDAHDRGFVESVGSGQLPHKMNWPPAYAKWVEGDFERTANHKFAAIARVDAGRALVTSPEVQQCLKHWPSQLHDAIMTLLGTAMHIFACSTMSHGRYLRHTEVSHDQFISLLDHWLEDYAGIEQDFSNCPFPSDLSSPQSASVGE